MERRKKQFKKRKGVVAVFLTLCMSVGSIPAIASEVNPWLNEGNGNTDIKFNIPHNQ